MIRITTAINLSRIISIPGSIREATERATAESAQLVYQSARDRIFMARRLNVQDSANSRDLNQRLPLRKVINGTNAQIIERQYWANVRSQAFIAAAAANGVNLTRKGLWMDRSAVTRSANRINGRMSRRYQTRQGLTFTKFSQDPNLARWAARRDKGRQYLRHAIRITPDIMERLTMTPALNRNREAIREKYQAAIAAAATRI